MIIDKNLAKKYDSSKTYAIDDIVLYKEKMYKCITVVETAEEFDESKWELCYITDLIGGTNSNLTEFDNFDELLSYSGANSIYTFTHTANKTGYLFANVWCNSKSATHEEIVTNGAKVLVGFDTIDTSTWETAGTNKLYMIYMPKDSTITINCKHNSGSTMRVVASAGFASK